MRVATSFFDKALDKDSNIRGLACFAAGMQFPLNFAKQRFFSFDLLYRAEPLLWERSRKEFTSLALQLTPTRKTRNQLRLRRDMSKSRLYTISRDYSQ